jgi:tetratricopeptide (TPR) repeat protein
MFAGLAVLAGTSLCLVTSSARADDKGDCKSAQTIPANRIAACTRLIDGASAGLELMMTYANRAAAKRAAGDSAAAIADFDAALAVDSKAARGYNETDAVLAPSFRDNVLRLRGVAKESTGDRVGALADFDAGLAQSPKSVWTRLARASVLAKLGRNADAIADYRAVLATEPAGHVTPTVKARAETGLKSLGATPKLDSSH